MADQPLVDRFRAWMREQNIPLTPQRLAVAELVFGADHAQSAEEIVDALAASGSRVGTATVYRTIEMLVESGFVEEQNRGEGFRRFEAKRELPHYEQLLCTVCGNVQEFRDAALGRMTDRIADAHGFMRERHRLVIYGTCAECQRAAAAREAGAQVNA